jgi:Fe-S oxidoreductase
VDPEGRFNRGKLMPGSGLDNAYTPSLQLLAQEALILEANDLGELNHMVKDCLRCGKCKPVCTTHVPAANLLYSPRNKILATGLMIEAVLYEEQTRRGISLRHFEEMNDVADHCTVCHRCITPCPVNIDFGDVTVLMRTILKRQGKRWFKPAGWLAMKFLNITDPRLIKVMRVGMVTWSYTLQRIGHRLMRSAGMLKWQKRPTATTGKPEMKGQLVQFFHRPMPGGMAQKSPRALLGIEDGHYIPIVRNPSRVTTESEALFYFPGCGSERLFGQVELATLNMLYDLDVQTVLPPGYLCCGYPQRASGDAEKGRQISMENRILFHRIANTLNYLDIKTVLVSCGTCMDQLMQYEFEQIFPGCRLLDIHEYLLEKGVKLEQGKGDTQYLFHDPCHSPMKRYSAQQVTTELTGAEVQLSDRCCGESGTFAVTRPDIATQVKFRKEQELKRDTKVLKEAKKILTSCPSCQQGLMRYQDNTGLEVDYLVVEMAKQLHGEAWQMKFLQTVEQGGVEQVLL